MAIVSNPKTLDLNDVQGMVVRGYGKLLETAYIMLKVEDAQKAKEWMKNALVLVDSADVSNRAEETLHLAFTASGLSALGMNEENVNAFPVPFREGMSTNNRSRILGDYNSNDPSKWRWGAKDPSLHITLIFHAKDKDQMKGFYAAQKNIIEGNSGLFILNEMHGFSRPDNKEPFGFHDGISQPSIKGSGRPGPENDMIETGEFLMGYKNEHGRFPYSPVVQKEQGNLALLSDDAAGSGQKDFGRNGSFLVFREIEQHVDRFWDAMEKKTLKADGSADEKAKVKLASKCIGRWPSGASLLEFPDEDPGGCPANDDFGYAEKDPHGEKCPFGSHLRRNNPRDAFRWYDAEQSLKISKRHRIIRRGRNYILPAKDGQAKGEEGLYFLCFNANIELQFEFIQHAWANNNQLRDLSNDVDVVIGVPAQNDPLAAKSQFTIQGDPVNSYEDNWEQFVTIKGGQYFFFPSISVLNYLTTI